MRCQHCNQRTAVATASPTDASPDPMRVCQHCIDLGAVSEFSDVTYDSPADVAGAEAADRQRAVKAEAADVALKAEAWDRVMSSQNPRADAALMDAWRWLKDARELAQLQAPEDFNPAGFAIALHSLAPVQVLTPEGADTPERAEAIARRALGVDSAYTYATIVRWDMYSGDITRSHIGR